MIVLHVIDVANPQGNGVAVAVSAYISQLRHIAEVATYNLAGKVAEKATPSFSGAIYGKISELPRPFNTPDLVVFNEVYKKGYLKLYKECIKRNIRYIVIPHGCLMENSQKRKRLKKIIGNKFFFKKFIENAQAIQFLCAEEEKQMPFTYKKAIIAGNGVEICNTNNNCPSSKDLVYIGRYDVFHKGLDRIVDICAKNKEWFRNSGIKIRFYGRDSANGLKILRRQIAQEGVSDIVVINGSVYGAKKEEVLNKAYLFIQCSRYEGLPMGIIEALAHGIPCIVTKGTNMAEYINANECGFGDDDMDRLFEKIANICENDTIRNKYSTKAFRAAKNDFEIASIIRKTAKEYEGILK